MLQDFEEPVLTHTSCQIHSFRRLRFASALLFVFLTGSVGGVVGQEWANDLFEARSHDFGSLARGAKAEFAFPLTNIYVEDVHIVSVRSSCGCTVPRIEKATLKTYERGAVIAEVNTRAFLGQKNATITVTFDKPFPAEVQLHSKAFIRKDVVLTPGSVDFGEVEERHAKQRAVQVDYAGRDNWRILDVQSDNPHIRGELIERHRGGGLVGYELKVTVDESAPAGPFHEHLMLITDDSRLRQVPVPVNGRVVSGITVTPQSLFMGVARPGQKLSKTIVVRGKKPFRILSIECDNEAFRFDTSGEHVEKEVHVIPVTFTADGNSTGKIANKIRIQTDDGSEPPALSAFAVIADSVRQTESAR
jgi:hypothetical protein